jgi:hypothetical protein
MAYSATASALRDAVVPDGYRGVQAAGMHAAAISVSLVSIY